MKVMLSCGEASGDLYTAELVRELRQREPHVEVLGFGGPRMRDAGAALVGEFGGLSVTGITSALGVVPRALSMVRTLTRAAAERRPDVFVAVDFPDFNFVLMRRLRRLGIPVVYYISPQLWAWRPGRMKAMRAHVDRVLVIFPFEEALYREAGVPVTFVGHPLVDLAKPRCDRTELLPTLGLDPAAPTVAVLPGSRPNELRRIAPTLAEAVPLIRAKVPRAQFVVARAPDLADELFRPLADVPTMVAATDEVLAASDVAITASGTATVQCALHERPMVVVYQLSALDYLLFKPFVTVETFAMANLVAGERIVPELVRDDFTPARIADETVGFLLDRQRYQRAQQGLQRVRERLGAPGASGRAAEAVLDVARGARHLHAGDAEA